MIPAAFYSVQPGSFHGSSWLYVVSLYSLFMILLLSLEWLWRIAWTFKEDRLPFKHPLTLVRISAFLLLSSIVMRVAPDVVLFGAWLDLDPASRFAIAKLDKQLDMISFLPFSISWLGSMLGGPIVAFQLKREPIPVNLWPTRRQLMRPLKIGLGSALMACAVIFFR